MHEDTGTFTIGQIARKTDVSVETIRFYQRRGLLDTPPKDSQGYRQYTGDTVEDIRFIRNAKLLGFTLKEIATLLQYRRMPGSNCGEARVLAVQKSAEMNKRLRELQQVNSIINQLIGRCSGDEEIHDCPIIKALDSCDTGSDPD